MMVADPTAAYRVELRSLRDQVLQAIDARVIGDLDDGLDLYGRLVEATFQTRADLMTRFGVTTSTSWVNPYGRELEWLTDDIRVFIDRAWRHRDSEEAPNSLLQFLITLLTTARTSNEIVVHRQFLGLLHLAFHRSLTFEEAGLERRGLDRRNLMLLRSYAEYQLVHGRAVDAETDDSNDEALLQAIATLFDDVRLAIDIDRSVVKAGLVEITELLDAIEFVVGRSGRAGLSMAIDHISAFVLGIAAYVIMRADHELLPHTDATDLLRQLRNVLSRTEPWRALQTALRERGNDFPWHDWEMGLWPDDQRRGFLGEIDARMRGVTIVIAAIGGQSLKEDAGSLRVGLPSDAEHAVKQVVDELSGLAERAWLVEAFPELGDTNRVQRIEQELAELVEDFKAEVERSRAARPIDPRKVQALANAVETTWLAPSALRGELRVTSSDEPESDVMFGYSSLVAKDYFTDSEVHAEPSRLGETIGRALARGETDLILNSIGGLTELQVSGGDIRTTVEEAVDTLRRRDCDPSIVVVNSWRAAVALGGRPFVRDPDATTRFAGARLDIEYSDRTPMCLVSDLSRLVHVRRWRVQPEKPFDALHANGLLLVGVEEMTNERAGELVSGNLEFRRASNGTLMSIEDAVRKLLGRVHVRALIRVDVRIADNSAGLVIPVSEDALS